MNAANVIAGQWVDVLWRATWQGGLVILVIAAFCFAAQRAPASVRAWLWWLAGIQLVLRLVVSIPIVVNVPSSPAPAVFVDSSADDSVVVTSMEGSFPAPAPPPPPARPEAPLLLATAWILGGLVVLAAGSRKVFRARSMVVTARPTTDPVAVGALEVYWGVGSGMPRLMESDAAPCPLLIGWLNPTIVLPARYAEANSPMEVRMAIAHEVAHVRKRHYLYGLGGYLTQLAFFFHPLSWLANREAALAREEVCDLEVLRLTGQSPSSYARLLLKSAQSGAPVAALGVALGYRDLRRRINMLKSHSQAQRSAYRRGWTSLVILIALASAPWQIVAQTKHSPTKPVATAAKKTHTKKAAHRRAKRKATREGVTITYESRPDGVTVRTVRSNGKIEKTIVTTKAPPAKGVDVKNVTYIVTREPNGVEVRTIDSKMVPTPPQAGPGAAPDGAKSSFKVVQNDPNDRWKRSEIITLPGPVPFSRVALGFAGGSQRLAIQVEPIDPKDRSKGFKVILPDGFIVYSHLAPGSTGKGPIVLSWRTGKDMHAGEAIVFDAPPRITPVEGKAILGPAPDPRYPYPSQGLKLMDPSESRHSQSTSISVTFYSENARAAIVKLLEAGELDYVFRADIPLRSVTCKLTNVTVEKALQTVLDSLDLHVRFVNGTAFIEH